MRWRWAGRPGRGHQQPRDWRCAQWRAAGVFVGNPIMTYNVFRRPGPSRCYAACRLSARTLAAPEYFSVSLVSVSGSYQRYSLSGLPRLDLSGAATLGAAGRAGGSAVYSACRPTLYRRSGRRPRGSEAAETLRDQRVTENSRFGLVLS